jgi:hemoglobin-like flavoprotein
MNHRQLELVRSSYERIRRVRPLFADLFNRRLMLIAPGLDRLLPADAAQRDTDFLELVELAVNGLDRLDVLLPALAAMAYAFRLRGVEPEDYDATGTALLWTVEQVLAGSPGAIAAWRETYDLLAGVMKRAAADADGPTSRPASRRTHTLHTWPPPPPSYRGPVSERSPDSLH